MLILWLALGCGSDPTPSTTPPATTPPAPTAPTTPSTSPTDPILPTLTLPSGTGDTATPGTGPTGDTGGEAPEDGDWLFDEALEHTFELYLSPESRASLLAEPTTWVPASLTVGPHHFPLIGVRLKGNGSFQPLDAKPSLKLDLDHYLEGTELDGFDDLVLDNMSLDPTWLRAWSANRLYAELGVPAPHSRWVTVEEHGRSMVHLLSEDKDGHFLNRWYDDGDGPFYELFDADFYADQIPWFDHDGGPDDLTAFYGIAQALDADGSRLSRDTDHVLDVQQWVTYFAISAVIGQFDAYPYSVPGDDVYLYVDPTDGRVDVLPHGVDEVYTDRWRPVDFTVGRLGTACTADPVCEQLWVEAMRTALDHVETRAMALLREGQAHLVATHGVEDCTEVLDLVDRTMVADDPLVDAFFDDAEALYGPTCGPLLKVGVFLGERRSRIATMPGVPTL